MWLKRLWWRLTGQPTLADYGERKIFTETDDAGSFARIGTNRRRLNSIEHGNGPEGKTITFHRYSPLNPRQIIEGETVDHVIPPSDLDTPEVQKAISELTDKPPRP